MTPCPRWTRSKRKSRPPKHEKWVTTRLGNTVIQIEMPQRPPEMAGTAVADDLKVSVLGKSTNQVWIAVEDVEWLINYVATEVALGGVPQVEAAAVAEGNLRSRGFASPMELWCTELASRVCVRKVERHNCSFKCVKNERRNGFPCLPQLRLNLSRRVSMS